jgi:hypothetical protein
VLLDHSSIGIPIEPRHRIHSFPGNGRMTSNKSSQTHFLSLHSGIAPQKQHTSVPFPGLYADEQMAFKSAESTRRLRTISDESLVMVRPSAAPRGER